MDLVWVMNWLGLDGLRTQWFQVSGFGCQEKGIAALLPFKS